MRFSSLTRGWRFLLLVLLGVLTFGSTAHAAGQAYSWGQNSSGQLGDSTNTGSSQPAAVQAGGVLDGKLISAVAAGWTHSLALTTDGRVYSWGSNTYGELGNGQIGTASNVPVAVNTDGVLAGKTVIAIAAGYQHSLALTSEGEVYSWGDSGTGQLGSSLTAGSDVPIAVSTEGALAGKAVIAIAAGLYSSLALTSDGQVYSWGSNNYGELGNGTFVPSSNVPVAVTMGGALAGKTVTKIAAGYFHNLVLSNDGKIYSWGYNGDGQLGYTTTAEYGVPVEVDMSGALAGKTVTAISAAFSQSLALADGKVYSWGGDASGLLGNGSDSNSNVPVAVSTDGALAEKTVTKIAAGYQHCLVLTSEGKAYGWGSGTYGQLGNVSNGDSDVPVAVDTTGTLDGKIVSAIAAGGFHSLAIASADPSTNEAPSISSVPNQSVIQGHSTNALAFAIDDNETPAGQLTVTGASSNQTLVPDGNIVFAGAGAYRTVTVTPATGQTGNATITLTVSDGALSASDTFVLHVITKLVAEAPSAAGKVYGWGENSSGQLGNATTNNSNVPTAILSVGALTGKTIVAIAGGTGHSLALTSEGKVYAWGLNTNGQLGIASSAQFPRPVDTTGVLAGKTIIAIAAGNSHSLALSSDGKIYSWGNNADGQLGNSAIGASSSSPIEVDMTGALAGKTVVAISAGYVHSLALTDDGQVYSWGNNFNGQLGNSAIATGTNAGSNVPVAVSTDGALAGKIVTKISAGVAHNLVLTDEGKVYGWGYNVNGQLGNGGTAPATNTPAAVNTSGALNGKIVTSIAAGVYHSLAVADGKVYSWGAGFGGVLGNGSEMGSFVPAPVIMNSPVAEIVIKSVTAGYYHSLALGTDGTLYSWGNGAYGQLGNGSNSDSNIPVIVTMSGDLEGKPVSLMASGYNHNLLIAPADNEAPTISAIEDQSIFRDNSTSALDFSIADSVTPAEELTVTGTSGNQTLVPDANIVFAGTGANRTVTVTPAAGQTGNATITVTVSDGNLSASAPFVLRVISKLVATPPAAAGQAYSWGNNNQGQLGIGTQTDSNVPVAVLTDGALNGKIITAVAGGAYHSLALTSDGSLYSWGKNDAGQLGIGTTGLPSLIPVAVDMTGALAGKTVIAIAAGNQHSLALTSDGKMYAWGAGLDGQLGNGGNGDSALPVAVNMSGVLAGKTVVAIGAGYNHNLVLTDEGTLYSWGKNDQRQLGDSTLNSAGSNTPVAVDMSGVLAGKIVIQIAAGELHNLVLTSDGKIYGWGFNEFGGLGNGSNSTAASPVAVNMDGVLAGKTVSAIAAGTTHSLAVTSDGKIYGWGDNTLVQLGNIGTGSSNVPVAVDMSGALAGKTVTAVSIGMSHNLALTDDGQVYSWGNSTVGQLGDAGNSYSSPPVAVDTAGALAGKTVSALASGFYHNLVIASAATTNEAPSISKIQNQSIFQDESTSALAFTIGDHETPANQLSVTGVSDNKVLIPDDNIVFAGTGANRTVTVTPAAGKTGNVNITVPVSDGALSTSETFAVRVFPKLVATPPAAAGQAYSWGHNDQGELGNGTHTSSNLPVKVYAGTVLAGKTITALAGGGSHTLALTSEGKIYSWGPNTYGELGSSLDNLPSSVPVPVYMDGALAGKTVIAIAAGYSHSLALTSDGKVYSWGSGQYGQLGNGSLTVTQSDVPVAVHMDGGLAGKTVVAIAAGLVHNLALTDDGLVYSWGSNAYGQLGSTGNSTSNVPMRVDIHGPLDGKIVTKIAAGFYHSLALTDDGAVCSWGYNGDGELGNGSTANAERPVAVNMSGALAGTTVTEIAGGGLHSLAVTSAGQIFSWGSNSYGQLGNGGGAGSNVPVAVDMTGSLAGKTVTSIAGGLQHSLALTSEGKIYSWGYGLYGELGNGANQSSSAPLEVNMNGRTVSGIASGSNHSLAIATGGPANQAPTITEIENQSILPDHSSEPAFTIADSDTAADLLILSATSDNQALVTDANIAFPGAGPNRTVKVTPAPGQTGQATITITVSDGELSANETFVLTVAGPNEPPTITDITNQTTIRNNPTGALTFTVGDSGTAAGDLTVTGASSNQALVPDANIVFAGTGANRTVTVTPVTGQTGTATITVTVSDGDLSTNDTFVLTVTLPSDLTPPSVTVTSPLNGEFIK